MTTLRTTPNRARTKFMALLSLICLATAAVVGASATAASAQGRTPVAPNMSATGGTVTGGGQPDRVLTDEQAAAFTQAWTPVAVYGQPEFETPPDGVPRYTITVQYVASDDRGEEVNDTIVVNLATDGTSSWLSLPEQELFGSFSVDAEQANQWFRGNPIVISAFNGELDPQPVDQPAASSTTTPESTTGSGDSSSVLLIVVIVVAAAIIIAAVILGARRRGTGG